MKILTDQRNLAIDLKGITLEEVLKKMADAKVFRPINGQSPELVSKNHFIFTLPRNRITSAEIHEFRYLEADKKIHIKSKYASLYFPGFLYYLLPIFIMCFAGTEAVFSEWKMYASMLIGITLFIALCVIGNLQSSSKHIQREMMVVINYLLREKGYKMDL